MSIKSVERQLRRTSEQWAQLSDEADTARLNALVSETPISEATHHRAARHADAIGQERSHVAERLGELECRQDALLDQMVRP